MRKFWKSLVLKARDVMADPDIRSEKKTGAMKRRRGCYMTTVRFGLLRIFRHAPRQWSIEFREDLQKIVHLRRWRMSERNFRKKKESVDFSGFVKKDSGNDP